MKNKRVEILVAAVVLFVSASPVMAVIEFNDGGEWNIGYTIRDNVWVDFETPGMGTTVNILSGGRLASYYHLKGFEDSIINILGGLNYGLFAYDSSQVISGGHILDDLRAYDSSHVVVSSGLVHYDLYAYDSSQVTVSGGEIDRTLYAYGNSQVTVSGGKMWYLKASGSSRVIVSGGKIIGRTIGDSFATDSSQITVSGGEISHLSAFSNSQITVSGGWMAGLDAQNSSQVNLSSGYIGNLYADDSSQVTISGGEIGYGFEASGNSQVSISGGAIGDRFYTRDSSQVTVSGGSIGGGLRVWNNAVLTIDGSDFAVDGTPVGYIELSSILGNQWYDEPDRRLTGTLLNGDPLDNDFRIGEFGKIVLVPEPATLLLLGLGGMALVRKRRMLR